MSKLLSRLGGAAAAAALVLSVGVGSAAASVTRYHESNGTVVSITTPDSVSAALGTQSQFPVTVSVNGPSPVYIATEKFLTAYGWGDSSWDGLSFAHYGCWGRSLSPGQSCTSTIAFTPTFAGSHTESYMIETGFSAPLYGSFTATGFRWLIRPPVASSLAP
jgi:hypothetical protein